MERLKEMLSARQFIALYLVCRRYNYNIQQVSEYLQIKMQSGTNEQIFMLNNSVLMRQKDFENDFYEESKFIDGFNLIIEI